MRLQQLLLVLIFTSSCTTLQSLKVCNEKEYLARVPTYSFKRDVFNFGYSISYSKDTILVEVYYDVQRILEARNPNKNFPFQSSDTLPSSFEIIESMNCRKIELSNEVYQTIVKSNFNFIRMYDSINFNENFRIVRNSRKVYLISDSNS